MIHGPAIRPARPATHTIPIVVAVVTEPATSGPAASLGRPGGNLTGVSIGAAEHGGKRPELRMRAVPRVSRVAVLWNAADASKVSELHDTGASAPRLVANVWIHRPARGGSCHRCLDMAPYYPCGS